MVNHPNRSKAAKKSVAFCDWLFTHISGRASVCLNGEIAGFDSERKEVFVNRQGRKSIWMPAGAFLQNLSTEEITNLENLPDWNGSNEYSLSGVLLVAVTHAIRRYRQHEIPSSSSEDDFDYFREAAAFTERVEDGCIVRSTVFHE
ncbi:MAG: hypothetical protein AB7E15_06880 [Azospira sp.]|jgi:hypothetical protein